MSYVNLGELRLDKYYRLFERAMGDTLTFGLSSPHGELVWHSESGTGDRLASAIREVSGQAGWLKTGMGQGLQRRQLDGGGTLLYRAVTSKLGGDIGYIVVLSPLPMDEADHGFLVHIDQVLGDIGSCIEAEYLLTEELNQMAEELSARYEELNLVYSMDERVKEYDPKQGTKVLKHLVCDCAGYLGVDAALLILPDDDINELHINPNALNELQPARDLLRIMKDVVLPEVKKTHAPMVVNDSENESLPDLTGKTRIGAVPVLDHRGETRGLLAAVTRGIRQELTNSDIKLLEVMAKQVDILIDSGYDRLTRMFNRIGFDTHCQRVTENKPGEEQQHMLMLLNMDQFKVVNDTCGALAGDELLIQIADLIRENTRSTDISSRLGNDEFAILLTHCLPQVGMQVADKLSKAIRDHRFIWDGKIFNVTAGIGVVSVIGQHKTINEYLGYAHSACLVAKSTGIGRTYRYSDDDEACARHTGDMEWVPLIQRALKEDRFRLFGQPIVPVGSSRDDAHHLEVLLRMENDDGSIVGPYAFITAAERFHLMPQIDRWVVAKVFDHAADQISLHGCLPVRLSVNLSGQSLSEDGFLEFILEQGDRLGQYIRYICFEITETAAISSFSIARQFIGALRDKGFEFSLDDFGSGLSSFSYLQNLPVDYLKIDGALVKEIATNHTSRVMVSAINQIGQVMNIRTIAEYVENEAILAELRTMGVDYAQGYLFGKPQHLYRQLEPEQLSIAASGEA